jgi:hypothetical protein
MAHLSPSLPPRAAINAGEYAELGLLKTLQTGLSDAYTLFHSVDWSRSSGGREQHGEIDIVVVNQSGDVLLIEVKSGGVDFQSDGIFKTYGDQRKSVTWQVRRQYGAMRSRLAAANLAVHVSQLLVVPDARVRSETAQWPREQIVDSTEFEQVVSRVAGALGSGSPNDIQPQVLAFFENRFRVVPDVSALTGRLQQSVTRLSAGLATWVPRIEVPSGIIRVVGTAGSGKTQLALRMLREADAVGQRAAYLCFNRALADHMAKVLPVRVPAETFHEFAVRIARRFGMPVDFSSRSFFREVGRIASNALLAASQTWTSSSWTKCKTFIPNGCRRCCRDCDPRAGRCCWKTPSSGSTPTGKALKLPKRRLSPRTRTSAHRARW